METLKIYTLSNFQIYNSVLLTIDKTLKDIAAHGSDWPCPKQALMTSLQRAFWDNN